MLCSASAGIVQAVMPDSPALPPPNCWLVQWRALVPTQNATGAHASRIEAPPCWRSAWCGTRTPPTAPSRHLAGNDRAGCDHMTRCTMPYATISKNRGIARHPCVLRCWHESRYRLTMCCTAAWFRRVWWAGSPVLALVGGTKPATRCAVLVGCMCAMAHMPFGDVFKI